MFQCYIVIIPCSLSGRSDHIKKVRCCQDLTKIFFLSIVDKLNKFSLSTEDREMKEKIKKSAQFVLVLVIVLLLIFSPYLLYLDYQRYGLFVALLWVVSITYFLWMRKQN